ncbi:hypothetical protein BKA62DRAFT_724619 [Auriculariales sp. MPI-PUGE-AT-0066]|nr:hypothetical protein BKA62DRAFT_724619 [Auriculariales sp. MPI-PUGE-AT-0066]
MRYVSAAALQPPVSITLKQAEDFHQIWNVTRSNPEIARIAVSVIAHLAMNGPDFLAKILQSLPELRNLGISATQAEPIDELLVTLADQKTAFRRLEHLIIESSSDFHGSLQSYRVNRLQQLAPNLSKLWLGGINGEEELRALITLKEFECDSVDVVVIRGLRGLTSLQFSSDQRAGTTGIDQIPFRKGMGHNIRTLTIGRTWWDAGINITQIHAALVESCRMLRYLALAPRSESCVEKGILVDLLRKAPSTLRTLALQMATTVQDEAKLHTRIRVVTAALICPERRRLRVLRLHIPLESFQNVDCRRQITTLKNACRSQRMICNVYFCSLKYIAKTI